MDVNTLAKKTDTIFSYGAGRSPGEKFMKQIIIQNLEDSLIHRLKKIAWAEGAPPDETARRLLIQAIQSHTAHPLQYRPADISTG